MSGFDVKVECLKEIEDGQCEALLPVRVEVEPEDRSVGIMEPFWYVDGTIECPHHKLDKDDLADIENRAIDEAKSELEHEYDGPDGPDEW